MCDSANHNFFSFFFETRTWNLLCRPKVYLLLPHKCWVLKACATMPTFCFSYYHRAISPVPFPLYLKSIVLGQWLTTIFWFFRKSHLASISPRNDCELLIPLSSPPTCCDYRPELPPWLPGQDTEHQIQTFRRGWCCHLVAEAKAGCCQIPFLPFFFVSPETGSH